jgi:hypothetical protein
MSVIPLHLQRRFEKKWISRFVVPVASNPKSAVTKLAPAMSPDRRFGLQRPKKNLMP